MGKICKTGWTTNTQHLEWKKWTCDFLKWPCHHTRWNYTFANVKYNEHVLWTAWTIPLDNYNQPENNVRAATPDNDVQYLYAY